MKKSGIHDVQQAVEGMKLTAWGTHELISSEQAIYIKPQSRDKVSVIVCGRIGYEAMVGFMLGDNLADAVIIDPNLNPYSIMRTAISVDRGKGILFICSYEENERNAVLSAGGLLEEAGFNSEVVYVWDNVVPDIADGKCVQRASAGVFYCAKIAGAAAASGLSLKETYYLAREARNLIKSISVGINLDRLQPVVNSIFEFPAGLELNIGMPGELSSGRLCLNSAEEIADRMLFHLLNASRIRYGDTVCAYISGFGGICFSDLSRVNYLIHQLLEERGIHIHDAVINPIPFKTSKIGVTATLMRVTDELQRYYDLPCSSLYFRKD